MGWKFHAAIILNFQHMYKPQGLLQASERCGRKTN